MDVELVFIFTICVGLFALSNFKKKLNTKLKNKIRSNWIDMVEL